MYKKRQRLSTHAIRQEINNHFKDQHLALVDLLEMHTDRVSIAPLFKCLEVYIYTNVRGITSTQLRNVADIVKDVNGLTGIEARKALQLCRPRLAHLIAKQPREEAKKLMVLADEVAALADDAKVHGYGYFIQMLIAFHKYYDTLGKRRIDPSRLLELVERDLRPTRIKDLLNITPENVDKVYDALQSFLEKNARGVTTTQLRNIYNDMEAKLLKALQLMKPALAYTAARQDKLESVKLVFLLMELLEKAWSKDTFMTTMETIVSIHKYQTILSDKRLRTRELLEESKKHFGIYFEDLLSDNTSHYDEIQDKIQAFAKKHIASIKPSQFRRLFDAVMETKDLFALKKLRPLFLYTAARQNNTTAIEMIVLFEHLMKHMKAHQLPAYKAFLQDVMAYHRYYSADSLKDKSIKKLSI